MFETQPVAFKPNHTVQSVGGWERCGRNNGMSLAVIGVKANGLVCDWGVTCGINAGDIRIWAWAVD